MTVTLFHLDEEHSVSILGLSCALDSAEDDRHFESLCGYLASRRVSFSPYGLTRNQRPENLQNGLYCFTLLHVVTLELVESK